jgi:hypothetical protein
MLKRIFTLLFFALALTVAAQATQITIAPTTVPGWQAGGTTCKVKVYVNKTFTASDGVRYIKSELGALNYYLPVPAPTCTISGSTVNLGQMILPSTTDALDYPDARYSLGIFDAEDVLQLKYFLNFFVPPSPTSTTWASLVLTNQANAPPGGLPPTYYTTTQTDAAITSRLDSSTPSAAQVGQALTAGANISIATSPSTVTISATGGGTVETIVDDNSEFTAAISAANSNPATLFNAKINATITVSAPQIIPPNLYFEGVNGGKIQRTGTGTLEFQGVGLPTVGKEDLFEGFAAQNYLRTASVSGTTMTVSDANFTANDVGSFVYFPEIGFSSKITARMNATTVTLANSATITNQIAYVYNLKFAGANYPKNLSAQVFSGGSFADKAKNATAALSGKAAYLIAAPGALDSRLILNKNHTLQLTAGVYTNNVNQQYQIVMLDNTALRGDGIGRTFLSESSAAGQTQFIYSSQMTAYPFDGKNYNIEVSDLSITGVPGQSVNSSHSAISLGNVTNGHVRRVRFDGTHGFGAYLGAFGFSGHTAENSTITDCIFHGLQTQNAGAMSGKNITISRNHFVMNTQPTSPLAVAIDVEPNDASDIIENFIISDNIIDLRLAQQTVSGVIVQAAPAPNARNIIISGNILIGADNNNNSFYAADVNAATDTFQIRSHGFENLQRVIPTNSGGAFAAGVTAGNIYYVIKVDKDNLKLASSYANAQAATAVDVAGQGTGTHNLLGYRTAALGIVVEGGDFVTVQNNLLRGFSQQCLNISNSTNVYAQNNTMDYCGGGGNSAVVVQGTTDSRLAYNSIRTAAFGSGSQDSSILENETSVTVSTTAGSPTVNRVTGTVMRQFWKSKTVTISGADYIVKEVATDGTSLTLTTNAASTSASTALTTKFSSNKYELNETSAITTSGTGTSVKTLSVDAGGTLNIPLNQSYNINGFKALSSNNAAGYVAINEGPVLGTTRIYGQSVFLGNGLTTYVDGTAGGKLVFDSTMTPSGTTGNQTINKISGSVNFAAGASSLTVTNSRVTANSLIHILARTNDATCYVKNYVAGAGTFTINLTANCTAETSVHFWVIN